MVSAAAAYTFVPNASTAAVVFGGRYCCVGGTHVLIIVLGNISTYRRAKVCLKL
jgi:hypothetical protein